MTTETETEKALREAERHVQRCIGDPVFAQVHGTGIDALIAAAKVDERARLASQVQPMTMTADEEDERRIGVAHLGHGHERMRPLLAELDATRAALAACRAADTEHGSLSPGAEALCEREADAADGTASDRENALMLAWGEVKRLRAALAACRQIVGWRDADVARLTAERDEARAESDRLSRAIDANQKHADETIARLDRIGCESIAERDAAIKERDEALDAVRDGGRRLGVMEALHVAAEERADKAERERDEALGRVHSCHDRCVNPACVMRRYRDTARAALRALVEADEAYRDDHGPGCPVDAQGASPMASCRCGAERRRAALAAAKGAL